jgi:hypothetical protein
MFGGSGRLRIIVGLARVTRLVTRIGSMLVWKDTSIEHVDVAPEIDLVRS